MRFSVAILRKKRKLIMHRSGRFLLLKLFSPQLHHGENIDIQYIQVNGYAGPRFFPKIEMR